MSEETHNTTVTQPQTVKTTEQATAPTKTPDQVKPQTVQTTKTVTDPKQPTVPVKTTDTIKPQPTGNTVSTAPTPAKTAEPVKPQTVQPTETVRAPEPTTPMKTPEPVKVPEPVASQPTQPTEVTKLSDVVPTSKVWISGLIGNRQIDCLGPIEIPLKIDKPTYPFTPVSSNPNYTNQVFDYDTGEWIATDAKSQGQILTDLTKKVSSLQESSGKYDQTVGQSQKISLLFTQNLIQLTNKMDVIEHKLDNLLNSRDSDK